MKWIYVQLGEIVVIQSENDNGGDDNGRLFCDRSTKVL